MRKLINLSKLQQCIEIIEKVHALKVRSLITHEEADAFINILKGTVTEIFQEGVKKPEPVSRNKEAKKKK